MMVKLDENGEKKAGCSPENKKARKTTTEKSMDPADFSAWMKDKMNPSPEKKKEIEELESKLETGKSQKCFEKRNTFSKNLF